MGFQTFVIFASKDGLFCTFFSCSL
uniref:Uncharacterized protein n=1 Tax=Rhizophora mucronata TaxID=61149 RepID=A0A2P2PIX6_RHIMU